MLDWKFDEFAVGEIPDPDLAREIAGDDAGEIVGDGRCEGEVTPPKNEAQAAAETARANTPLRTQPAAAAVTSGCIGQT